MSRGEEPETLTGEPVLDPTAQSRERVRPDPRDRPPDPAGTQPKVDPDSLLPSRREATQVPLLGAPSAWPSPPTPGEAVVKADPPGELDAALPPSQHAPRFQFLLGALAAIAAAAAAIAVAVIASPKPAPPPAWSNWQPISGDVDPAQQIADHVAPEYRLDSGHQLVSVQGGPLSIAGQPAELALRTSGSPPSLLPGNGVVYQLCGAGPSCSISEGVASEQRLLLLEREALELALYTFRYVNGAAEVVVIVPPKPPSATSTSGSARPGSAGASGAGSAGSGTGAAGSSGAASSGTSGSASAAGQAATVTPSANHALLFRPGDVAPELDRPLVFSLTSQTPTVSTVTKSADAGLVVQLTKHNLYDWTFVQDAQSNPVLLLQPRGLGG